MKLEEIIKVPLHNEERVVMGRDLGRGDVSLQKPLYSGVSPSKRLRRASPSSFSRACRAS